jgi:SET domain-containing protein
MEVNEQKEINYQPLSNNLTIKQSDIHGLGLFATMDIEANTELGWTHIKHNDEMIRTPLGGFINHSNSPNCHKQKVTYKGWDILGSFLEVRYSLITNKKISQGDELTLAYDLYKV